MTSDAANADLGAASGGGSTESTLRFHYVKGAHFRAIHVDGAHGAISPDAATIHLAFFNERFPIPVEILVRLEDGEEVSRVERDGILRELEVNAIMNLDTAEFVVGQLTTAIESLRSARSIENSKGV